MNLSVISVCTFVIYLWSLKGHWLLRCLNRLKRGCLQSFVFFISIFARLHCNCRTICEQTYLIRLQFYRHLQLHISTFFRYNETIKTNSSAPSFELGVSLASTSDSLELLPEDFLVASVDWKDMKQFCLVEHCLGHCVPTRACMQGMDCTYGLFPIR